jgi:hypothetical protein
VKRRNEPVATDTVFSNTPVVDYGVTAAQIFVGLESLVADVYGLKTDKEFINTLEDINEQADQRLRQSRNEQTSIADPLCSCHQCVVQ